MGGDELQDGRQGVPGNLPHRDLTFGTAAQLTSEEEEEKNDGGGARATTIMGGDELQDGRQGVPAWDGLQDGPSTMALPLRDLTFGTATQLTSEEEEEKNDGGGARATTIMGGDELQDGRQGIPAWDGLQDGPSTVARGGGAAFVPATATATSSCISNQKSDGCSPAIFGDTDLMRPLLPLCDLTFGTAAQLTSEEEENNDGLAAQRATDKKEKKNARNRERAKRNRMNRRFQAQIDHGFNEKREIFNGSIGGMDIERTIARKDLEITEVTQLSEMKEITGYGSRGNGMPRFRGAIVAEEHGRHTRYIGVPEGRFMRHDPCWAKHGSHKTAKWLLAFRKTGVVDNMVIIAWESKPNEWALVHESRTLDFSSVQQNSRPTAGPKRFEPGASDMLRKTTPVLSKDARSYYEFYRSDDFKSNEKHYTVRQLRLLGNQCWREIKIEERNHETKVHKLKNMHAEEIMIRSCQLGSWTPLSEEIRQDIEQSPPPRDPGHKNEDEKKKYEEEMREYEEYEKKLISDAVKAYEAMAKTPNPHRPIKTRPLSDEQLELSLIHDVIRGNVKGSLGIKVDAELGLSKDTSGTKYMDLLVHNVGEMTIQIREAEGKTHRKTKRKPCKFKGCGNLAWNGGGGKCYLHTPLPKRMCCQCKTRTKKYAGGLCEHCRGPRTGELGTVFCPVCGVRAPVRPGSKCKKCIGGSLSGSKRKKVKKAAKWSDLSERSSFSGRASWGGKAAKLGGD